MQFEHRNNRTQKTIATFMVILAVVIVTVGVSALNHKKASVATVGTTPSTSTTTTPGASSSTPAATTTSSTSSYKDGTYTANSSYQTPGGQEGISVNLTVQNGAVSNVTVQNQSNNHESQSYQSTFVAAYKSSVVGKKLSDINVSGVSGSSLTEVGFDDALTQIKSQAQSA